MANIAFLVCSLLILSAVKESDAVDYTVTNNAANTAGGARFDGDIGVDYTRQTLEDATAFIWNLFQQTDPSTRKNVQQISLFVDDMDGVAYTSNDQIHVSAQYIASIGGDVREEITGVLYHETTHVWQWNGNGQAPSGLIEGIADFVRLKADYAPSHWVSPGQGDRWDQGYDVTARFLDYCEGLRSGFVAELNMMMMRDGYDDSFFQDLLGESVNQLWDDYKARYNN